MPRPTKRKMAAEDAEEAFGSTAPTSFFHGQHEPLEEQPAIGFELDVDLHIDWLKELGGEPGPSLEHSKLAPAESIFTGLTSYTPPTAYAPIQSLQPPVIKGPADCPVVGCSYSAAHCKNPSNSMNSHLINKGAKDEAHAEAKKSFTMKAFTQQVKSGLPPSSERPPRTKYNKAAHGFGPYDSNHHESEAGPSKKSKRARKSKANEAHSIIVTEDGEPSSPAIREDKAHEQAKATEVEPYDDTLDAEGSDDEEYYASVEEMTKFGDIGGQQEVDGGHDSEQAWMSTLSYRYHM